MTGQTEGRIMQPIFRRQLIGNYDRMRLGELFGNYLGMTGVAAHKRLHPEDEKGLEEVTAALRRRPLDEKRMFWQSISDPAMQRRYRAEIIMLRDYPSARE